MCEQPGQLRKVSLLLQIKLGLAEAKAAPGAASNRFASCRAHQHRSLLAGGPLSSLGEHKANMITLFPVDEGRKRVLGIMAAILASLHMQTADDLFGGPQGSPRSDKLIAASVQWAEKIMEKIDNAFRSSSPP